MKFLINTHHTKGPCAGLFNYMYDIGIIQLFYYLIKSFCVLATTNFSTFRIYYMEKRQQAFTAKFYRTWRFQFSDAFSISNIYFYFMTRHFH